MKVERKSVLPANIAHLKKIRNANPNANQLTTLAR